MGGGGTSPKMGRKWGAITGNVGKREGTLADGGGLEPTPLSEMSLPPSGIPRRARGVENTQKWANVEVEKGR